MREDALDYIAALLKREAVLMAAAIPYDDPDLAKMGGACSTELRPQK